MKRRILFAGLFHETHTFVEGRTKLGDFQIRRGSQMLACTGDASPLGSALQLAADLQWEILPAADYRAVPGPTVDASVYEQFIADFSTVALPELERGVDAIFLILHGAMVTDVDGDVEGTFLLWLRTLPGAATLPVFGVYDLHANFSARMAAGADCLVAYRENPHADAAESACRAVRLLDRCLQSRTRPRTLFRPVPLLLAPTATGTVDEPMRSLESLARRLEEIPEFWSVNVASGFAFADTPDTRLSFQIATTGSTDAAESALGELAAHAWELRDHAGHAEESPEAVMKQLPATEGLAVIAEPSDNIGGGAPGDGTGLLRALIAHSIPNCAVAINDPESVARLQGIPIGGEMDLSVGGKGSPMDAGPVPLRATLISRSDGRFQLEDRQSHLASLCGDVFEMGPSAVVRSGGVTLLLTSKRTAPMDLGQWRSQGIAPEKLSVIGVKAAVAHRRAYDPIAARMFWVNTPGPCSSDLKSFPYRQLSRPIHPLDPTG
ncbi:MAG: M81 family peptidase [Pedosphaera sp.]|nr:M81 family peptidase [Pedosphaera sp.]